PPRRRNCRGGRNASAFAAAGRHGGGTAFERSGRCGGAGLVRTAASDAAIASAGAARTSRPLLVRRGDRDRHSVTLSVVRILGLFRHRGGALLSPAAAVRALRAARCQLLFLCSLERVVRT